MKSKTRRTLIASLLILSAAAPAWLGVAAQSVSSAADSRRQTEAAAAVARGARRSAARDSAARDGIGGVLDFLSESDVSGNENTEGRPDTRDYARAGGILDNIISSGQKEVSSRTVLDFMANVYSSHDYYQTGKWDDAEDFSYITRNVKLPPYNPDDFYRPVWGRVTSGFGYRPSFGRVHKGIDLALNVGDTVRAALPGVVAKTGYDAGGYGHYVVLVHNNGMETRYAHLQRPVSSPGQSLDAGDPLGLGGNTGNSTGPHLHFEVRYRGSALDPATIFNFHSRSLRPHRHR